MHCLLHSILQYGIRTARRLLCRLLSWGASTAAELVLAETTAAAAHELAPGPDVADGGMLRARKQPSLPGVGLVKQANNVGAHLQTAGRAAAKSASR